MKRSTAQRRGMLHTRYENSEGLAKLFFLSMFYVFVPIYSRIFPSGGYEPHDEAHAIDSCFGDPSSGCAHHDR